VPLDRDRTLLWVEATLNAKPGTALIVDPGIDEVRLPARLAAEVGVQPSEGGEESLVVIPLEGGRTVRAWRARLASVQLGPVSAADVECLVLPAEYGAAPALLGNSFLKRFTTHIDADAGALLLSHVQSKLPSRASKPATAKPGRTPPGP
jgi:predicted aspartyl protease